MPSTAPDSRYQLVLGSGYRLPNIKELQSLVEEACYNNSINETFFPATPRGGYWSASPNADGNISAWLVTFRYGQLGDYLKDYNYHVRAVRAGQ